MNAHVQQFTMMPIANIALGKNVRSQLGDLDELTASVRENDILQPLTVRRVGFDGQPELVFGFRRLAAAKRAGFTEVPVIIRDLSDSQVIEAQIAENIDRDDMHPLDESRAFSELLKQPGYDIPRVAEKIGRTPTYVAQRLKLQDLSERCRKALDDKFIPLQIALLLARIPDEKLQDLALDDVAPPAWGRDGDREVLPAAEAAKMIEERYMLMLSGAPFDITDQALVAAAGPCSQCPKRTGAQRELFPDVKSPDVCIDPTCYRSKLDALWQIKAKEHKVAGGEVLSAKDSERVLGNSWEPKARELREQYTRLDHKEYIGPGMTKSIKSLFGKELPPIILAKDPETGRPVELVSKKDADAAVRKAKKEKSPEATKRGPSAAEKKRSEEERRAGEIRRAITAKMVDVAEQYFMDELVPVEMARVLVVAAAESMWNETIRKAADRRRMPEAERKGNVYRNPQVERIKTWAAKQPVPTLLAMLLELLTSRTARDEGETTFKRALKLLAVDPKAVAKEVLKRKGKPADPEELKAAGAGEEEAGEDSQAARKSRGKGRASKRSGRKKAK